MDSLQINVTIPTYNRAGTCLARAIEGALGQTYPACTVTVVDDGSSDDTPRLLRRYQSEPRFCSVRLGRNVGTAQAKNVSLLLSRYDAITFHDSDDIPSEHKVLLQSRALSLPHHRADEILDWRPYGHRAGDALPVDVVVGAYRLVKMDGSVFVIDKRVSLVDDFFPNLQFPSKTEGDWCLINAGLFRRNVFERLGGYLDSIEEDRELRNRTIASGCIYYFVGEPLLTKVEMNDSLTIASETSFTARRRLADRDEVWRRNRLYREGLLGPRVAQLARVTVDLAHIEIEEVIHPELLCWNRDIPCTAETQAALARAFGEPLRAPSPADEALLWRDEGYSHYDVERGDRGTRRDVA